MIPRATRASLVAGHASSSRHGQGAGASRTDERRLRSCPLRGCEMLPCVDGTRFPAGAPPLAVATAHPAQRVAIEPRARDDRRRRSALLHGRLQPRALDARRAARGGDRAGDAGQRRLLRPAPRRRAVPREAAALLVDDGARLPRASASPTASRACPARCSRCSRVLLPRTWRGRTAGARAGLSPRACSSRWSGFYDMRRAITDPALAFFVCLGYWSFQRAAFPGPGEIERRASPARWIVLVYAGWRAGVPEQGRGGRSACCSAPWGST